MFLLVIIILGLIAYYYPYITGKIVNNKVSYEREKAFVLRVVDGDTIETNVGTVRLLGINTPEKGKAYYSDAKDSLRSEIENKSVELLRDGDDTDKYNRKLRYVFLGDRLINVEVVERGLATTFMIDNLNEDYKNKFVSAEKFARQNAVDLWKKSSDECADCIKLVEINADQEFFVIRNDCESLCDLKGWIVKDDANHFFYLDNLDQGEEKRYDSKTKLWNDDHDRFFMRDSSGDLVVFYSY